MHSPIYWPNIAQILILAIEYVVAYLGSSTKTGLVLHTCPNIQALLSVASTSTSIAPALQNAAVQYLDAPVVPYPIVRDLWVQLTPAYGVPFHQVLAGSSFVLEAPKPREKVHITSINLHFHYLCYISFVEPMFSVRVAYLSKSMRWGRPKDETKFCNADVNHHCADKHTHKCKTEGLSLLFFS